MKRQTWAVTVRYAAAGPRPGNHRHPAPDDFRRRTVVGPVGSSTVEAVFDLLEVPEDVRAKIRAYDVVKNFVEGKLVPDDTYPHHHTGAHYVSRDSAAQLVEWDIAFVFVSRIIEAGGGEA
ncbi:MAG TPA: hypothetical protein VLE97_08860 [Gaiellaceae bacterium]|nr:hypothetical protein [Gaiellaceae bacterium]